MQATHHLKRVVGGVAISLLAGSLIGPFASAQESTAEGLYKKLVADQAAQRAKQIEDRKVRNEEDQKKLQAGIEEGKALAKKRAEKRLEDRRKFREGVAAEDAEREREETELRKICGSDYGEIRVGMKLSRVQQCFSEVSLQGQIKTKDGTVDHYVGGGVWLYSKKGRVVAWGE